MGAIGKRRGSVVFDAAQLALRNTMGRSAKLQALVVCVHLRPGRNKRRSRYVMQPISGLHVASLIGDEGFDVRLHHEDWHGPFDVSRRPRYDLVFLTGLQVDFDRMRQLAFFFRRDGAVVVAGGSVCTLFPEFAAEFFDVVCAGGVESAAEVAADFLTGRLKPIYRSPIAAIRPYRVDYRHFARNGISPSMHLVEASRGCSFRCAFCTMPSEVGGHAGYPIEALAEALDSATASAPFFSFRRWYPTVLLLDNNFSDNRAHMLAVSDLLRARPDVRGWGALVTQNILQRPGAASGSSPGRNATGCSSGWNRSTGSFCAATTRRRTSASATSSRTSPTPNCSGSASPMDISSIPGGRPRPRCDGRSRRSRAIPPCRCRPT